MIELFLLPLKSMAQGCKGDFFGFPAWYTYLDRAAESGNKCAVKLNGLNDIWLIALAITQIMLRVAILAAIIYVVVGGVKYITSQGNPEKTTKAKNTVGDGLVGVVIAVVAAAVIGYIAGRFQG